MSFNPQCWYLQREAVGTKRHKYIQFDKQNKSFGRSSANDYFISSRSCSKKHCEIYFRDGRIFIQDFNSKLGTFVNNVRIPVNTERELAERDVIGFGINPAKADKSNRGNFIFSLLKSEKFTLESDDDDDSDILEIIDFRPEVQTQPSIFIDETNVPCLKSGSNNENSLNEPKSPVIEPEVPADIKNETPNTLNQASSCLAPAEPKSPVTTSNETPNILNQDSSCLAPTSTIKLPENVKVLPPNIAELTEKNQKLRHWQQQGAQLIDALPMEHKRKRKIPIKLLPESKSEATQPPRKRGRPKMPDEIKQKLKSLPEKKEPKVTKAKPKRAVKVKNTLANRSDFLTEAVPKVPKRGRSSQKKKS